MAYISKPLTIEYPDDLEDMPPETAYLVALARGSDNETAHRKAGFPLLGVARANNPEFAALESILKGTRGNRPELARQLLAHESLSAVLRLHMEAVTAEHSRDRTRANVALLDYGPLAPKMQAPVSIAVMVQNIHQRQASEPATIVEVEPAP